MLLSDLLKGNSSGGAIKAYTYDNRAQLRTASASADAMALVEGIGLFMYVAGSSEIDDDETCFATASGRWLIEAAHPELIEAMQILKDDEQNAITGKATSTITMLASLSTTTIKAEVIGAQVGDVAFVSPDTAIDSELAIYARVTADNTVTIHINNPSSSTATLTNPTTYSVGVIKTP